MMGENRYKGANFSADDLLAQIRAKNKPENDNAHRVSETIDDDEDADEELTAQVREGYEEAGYTGEELMKKVGVELQARKQDAENAAIKEMVRKEAEKTAKLKVEEQADRSRRDALIAQLLLKHPEELKSQTDETEEVAPAESGVRVKPGTETHEPKNVG